MSTAPASACSCPRCTIERRGVSGPFTPAEFVALGLDQRVVTPAADDPVTSDPQVQAATLAVQQAREAFAPYEHAYLAAVAEHRAAEMAADLHYGDGHGGLFSLGGRRRAAKVGELARQRKDAREAMELAHKDVVGANEALREAITEARVRAAEAARGG